MIRLTPRRATRIATLLAALSAMATLAACSSGDSASPTGTPPSDDTTSAGPGATTSSGLEPEPAVGVDVDATDGPHGLDGSERPELGRDARRLRIDALEAAMTRVAGADVDGAPLVWKVNGVNGFSDASFGKALGRPDYRVTTDENPTSSALYLKLVGDAARDLCMQMAKNDLKRFDPASRTLFPKAAVDGTATPADVDANLSYLALRFLGLKLDATHPLIVNLRDVYAAGVASAPQGGTLGPEAEAWRGVCVALYESPLFHND